jgi:hypothetical protein
MTTTRWALLVLAPALAVTVGAAIVAIVSRESDAAFVFRQENPRTIEPIQLETLVKKAPEPTPRGPGARASSVRCVPGGKLAQRNPWTCRARYPSGRRRSYRIVIQPDGKFRGIDPSGQFEVSGCCVAGGTFREG